LILVLFSVPSCLWADSGLDLLCASRTIANHLIDGEIQRALDLSIECEDRNLKNIKETFAEQILKSAYLVSAQILTAQGKFDMARDRLERAKTIPGTVLILLDELMDTTEGYLLERSGQPGEAVNFYRRISKPHALVRLGVIYLDQGRTDDALRVIIDSLKSDPSDPAAHAILGEILERSDKSAALREYKLALTLAAQGNPSVVALTYFEVGRAKRGIARLQQQ
jgi:tetratricopeptide (TPR) repeat protein